MPVPSDKEINESHTSDFEFRWKNFRSLEDTGWLKIKPLTILLGPNSSGKSSLIAPVLMFAQTIQSRDGRSPLVSRGKFVDLGTFKEIVTDHETEKKLELGVRFHVHKHLKSLDAVGSYPPAGFELILGAGKDPSSIELESFKVTDLFGRTYFTRKKIKTGYGLSGAIRASKMTKEERLAVRKARRTNFFFTPTRVLSEYESLESEKSDPSTDFSPEFSHYLKASGRTAGSIFSFFNSLTYIGPLRSKPFRHYKLSGEEIFSVGVSGENTASLLKAKQQQNPKELNKWVKAFGFGQSVNLKTISDDLASILFSQKEGAPLNIADLGFGASQIFPLIVQSTLADGGSLTIAEQPEVHLNPKLQGMLGDLFVQLANQGQHVLLETHSEHLLLRVRTLIAKEEINASDVAIYFVEKLGGRSIIRKLNVDANGHIPDSEWPNEFFDDALKESISLVEAQISRKSSKS